MEQDLPNPRIVASARQVTDLTEDEDAFDQQGPLTIAWFALGHAAVLLYLALKVMTPMERGLTGGAVAAVGLALALLLRAPASRRGLAAEAED